MGKFKILIILVLVAAAFGAGIYFKTGIKNFQESQIGSTIAQVAKEIISPPPLNVGGQEKQVVLLQSKIIEETNLQRQENGDLPALTENEKLNEAAAQKASDMFSNQYFEHVSPTGVDPGKLMQNSGYDYIVVGENLILGNFSSEKDVVQNWMNSPGHRANILNNRYTEIGVAIVKGTYNGQKVWIGVQEFGLPLSSCSEPSSALKNEIEIDEGRLDFLTSQINEKKSQVESTNPHSAFYSQMISDYNSLVAEYNSLVESVKSLISEYNSQVNNFNNCVTSK